MGLSRRTVLKGGSALSISLLTAVDGSADVKTEVKVKTVFLLLDGIGRGTPPDLVERVLDRFFRRRIPVGIVFDGANVTAPAAETVNAALLRYLGQIAGREPGLLELVPAFAATDDPQRYFQLRRASELRRRLADSALGEVMGERIQTIVSVVDRSPKNTTDPYAFRAAGFRIQIRTGAGIADGGTAQSRVAPMDWGLLGIEGGYEATILGAPDEVLSGLFSSEGDQLLTLSLAGAETVPPEMVLTACDAWADALLAALWQARIFITRPSDHLLQDNPGASKYLALLLDYRGGADMGLSAFARDLDSAGFAYSILSASGAEPGSPDTCYDHQIGSQIDPAAGPDCMFGGLGGTPAAAGAVEILLLPSDTPHAWTGLREDCRFQIALSDRSGGTFSQRHADDPLTDQVELIPPGDVATEIQRRALLRALEDTRRDGRVHFYSVRGFMEEIVAPEPALRRIWSLRRRRISDPFHARTPDRAEAERLVRDARLAWRYIEKHSNKKTGICAGTASLSASNRYITLWDIGSQLFGIDAANRLGLIGNREAKDWIGLILDNLPVQMIGGLPLPPALFQSDTLRPARTAYDACDTGRFLVALAALAASGLIERSGIRAVLERWDLAGAIKAGRVFNFSNGRWVDATVNHCTPYTKRGFAAWGMNIETSLPALDARSSGDDLMRFLHQVAVLGHYGAEPALLEAVEQGQGAEARFLSDVLFDAQLEGFENRGELRAVSEAPLNFAPWFIYQGLRVDRWGDAAWVISTRSRRASYDTPEFRDKAALISSKSAFLWAAAYPHPYSDRLLSLVREKARIEDHGFSVGIFARSLEPMKGYSDLNTNGVILTAIAHMLAPRAPD